MIKRLFLTVVAIAVLASLKGQVVHDIGIGFSGLRIWEPSPPINLNEDLDYYWNPQLSYQLHFFDERVVAGLQFGWVYAKGLKDEENYFREDIQKSLNLDVEAGANLFRFKNSFVQWTAGVRLTKTYYHSLEVADGPESNVSTVSYEIDRWRGADYDNYDLTSTLSFQQNLFFKRPRNTNLALRLALETVYFFPGPRVFKSYPSDYRFAMGSSVSLIWRIRGKRNRGLF